MVLSQRVLTSNIKSERTGKNWCPYFKLIYILSYCCGVVVRGGRNYIELPSYVVLLVVTNKMIPIIPLHGIRKENELTEQ